ncbi:L,D-transpeptidase family protein [Aquabacterium sp. A7-Y]|uniref:L,D-transpeptidase family protein n=1 Tax=Aquabacterium sp. A7-Y TaxID=1349605 RepID=UPI00223D13BF|nr:L,D-transpeptidase family protein [Aquabacterium sp. A7-Y]MCW7540908.1 L,D-transpeptidase family protein [Aquabacterium sp. A7-Y]
MKDRSPAFPRTPAPPSRRWIGRRAFAARGLLFVALVTALVPASGHPSAATAGSAPATTAWAEGPGEALRQRLQSSPPPLDATPGEHEELQRLYRPDGYRLRWLDASGRPSLEASEALALLGAARSEGLAPEDYHAEALGRGTENLMTAPAPDRLATWDLELSLGMLRYLRHLHFGRVAAKSLGFRLPSRDHEHDFAALLDTALRERRLGAAVAGMAPPLWQYRQLRSVLAHYRTIVAEAADESLPSSPPVRPGDRYADAAVLQRRLRLLGDLAPTPSEGPPTQVYEPTLVEAVKRFQARHGLATDGVLGRTTQAALNVPLATRVRQIELALERLRWLPHLGARPFIAVNIPMFRLWASPSPATSEPPPLEMGVIVGRALKTQTPIFTEEMRYLIFRPYWNVPASILRQEILPALQRDPAYLARHQMELVAGSGDTAPAVETTPEHLALLRQGRLRVRQRPGPANSLGLVKFIFPNDHNVYLHGTPAQGLFARDRRDFSHGCIRLEDPVRLAEWVLRDETGAWTRERIRAAMTGSASLRVDLKQPVPVIVYYVTAIIDPKDGRPHFADDLYGHDRRLERLMSRSLGVPVPRAR